MNIRSQISVSAECDRVVIDVRAVDNVRAVSRDARHLKALADIFGALGDPTRLRILLSLAVEPLCVCDLAVITGVSQSAVSHQLRILRNLDLVAYRRDGHRAVYRLSDAHVSALLAQGGEHVDERRGGEAP